MDEYISAADGELEMAKCDIEKRLLSLHEDDRADFLDGLSMWIEDISHQFDDEDEKDDASD